MASTCPARFKQIAEKAVKASNYEYAKDLKRLGYRIDKNGNLIENK